MTMTPLQRGLLVAALHVLLVCSLGAKLLVDRATRPRVWARSVPYDPDLPIRGRYVRIRLEALLVEDAVIEPAGGRDRVRFVQLETRGDELVARSTRDGLYATVRDRDGQSYVVLSDALAYFIPENVADPSVRQADEELWVEVTLPRAGLPRPIRLGVRRHGVLTPLEID